MADEDIFLAAAAKDCGMMWRICHNKATGRVSQSWHYAMSVIL